MRRSLSVVARLALGIVAILCLATSTFANTYTGPGGVIPDAASLEGPPGIITSDIAVPDAIAIETLKVTVTGFTHTWCGDIIISVTHVESGLTRTLVSRIGLPTVPPPNFYGDSSNYGGDYSFADPFVANIWTAAAAGGSQFVIPPGGYYATAPGTGIQISILEVFGGASAAGTWRLTISDEAAGDMGAFTGWTLEIIGDEFDPCPAAGSCFIAHATPGCDDEACCTTVCGIDPVCCAAGWDATCADEALATCGGCGDRSSGDCCTAHAGTGCNQFDCCGAVCAVSPACCEVAWDAACAALAALTPSCGCIPPPPMCGDAGAGDCCTVHDGPACTNAPCCQAVCVSDPFCCEIEWDAQCVTAAQLVPACDCEPPPPDCGDSEAGDCCTVHAGPACADAACCTGVCALDSTCCDTQWDRDCVALALRVPACECVPPVACGDAGTGDCCAAHAGPFCENGPCCDAVCAVDPSCCEIAWDGDCAAEALTVPGCGCIAPPACGDAGTGDCCAAHAGPLCENAPCCEAVCDVDPSCCEIAWDGDCATAALTVPACGCIAPPACGNAGTGDCCAAHAGPLCDNAPCCEAVCDVDPSCCEIAWDADCAAAAQDIAACGCPPPPPVCPGIACCFEPAATKGCNGTVCCQMVCDADPFCCEVSWDLGCVLGAYSLCCPGDFNVDGIVDGADLGELLSSFGQIKPDADFNCDGIVNGSDLGIFLSNWGECGG